jgi:hypothetical protein
VQKVQISDFGVPGDFGQSGIFGPDFPARKPWQFLDPKNADFNQGQGGQNAFN